MDYLTIVFSVVMIICGNLLLASCLSGKNWDKIKKADTPCPSCSCEPYPEEVPIEQEEYFEQQEEQYH